MENPTTIEYWDQETEQWWIIVVEKRPGHPPKVHAAPVNGTFTNTDVGRRSTIEEIHLRKFSGN